MSIFSCCQTVVDRERRKVSSLNSKLDLEQLKAQDNLERERATCRQLKTNLESLQVHTACWIFVGKSQLSLKDYIVVYLKYLHASIHIKMYLCNYAILHNFMVDSVMFWDVFLFDVFLISILVLHLTHCKLFWIYPYCKFLFHCKVPKFMPTEDISSQRLLHLLISRRGELWIYCK